MLKSLTSAAFAVAAFTAMPAAAQEATVDEKVNMVIVYGDDDCPPSTDQEIVVCARQAESERYRIPETLRFSEDPANSAWARRVERLEMVGAFGTMSCSPAGAGGFSGCTQQMIDAAYADKKEGSDVRFGQLIAQAREDRLSTIDGEAAAEQERVEQIEREYMQRLERDRDAPTPEEAAAAPLPTPQTTAPAPTPEQ